LQEKWIPPLYYGMTKDHFLFFNYQFIPMSIFLGILLTLVVLLIVVMIHEFGHFITARLTGMKVEEFGIGIPPRAKRFFTDKK